MKVINWYTASLVFIAIVSFFYSFYEINFIASDVFFVMAGIVIILEILPIQMPSGDRYSAGSIGFLFLLLYDGLPYAIMAIFIASLAYYLKSFRKRRIPLIRFLVTIGMYAGSVAVAFAVWKFFDPSNVFMMVFLVAIAFEVTNFILLEGIEATVFGKRMFNNLKQKISELIIPILISIIVLSKLISQNSKAELITLMLYTLFFMLIVIFFSHEFIKQLMLRQSASKAFIQILEGRIKSSLTGHGSRVASICEILLDDFGYPKSKRNDLVQAAIIHDIGKALLPTYIFRKRGELTLSEEREYKSHPEKAMEVVETMFPKDSFSSWILHHHERWDGKGFPRGLQGEAIPVGSRILAIGNEMDHIISRHKDKETVFKLLKEKAGTQLDPKLVEKIEMYHIEMILETIPYPTGQKQITENYDNNTLQYSDEDTYSHIGESFFIKVKDGQVDNPMGIPPNEFIKELANVALDRKEPVQEKGVFNKQNLNLHAFPVTSDEVLLFAHNITPYLDYRKRLEHNILESYVLVINTISEGKIRLLTSKTVLESQLGTLIDEMSIQNSSDVPKSRDFSKRIIEDFHVEMATMKILVAVSETASNIVKHATAGNFTIYRKDKKLQFLFTDRGSGIPLHELPKAILISGYSSKRSLGRGFKLIANYSDGLQIYSCSEGTSILMEFNLK
mgnify:CR=1 FL=1